MKFFIFIILLLLPLNAFFNPALAQSKTEVNESSYRGWGFLAFHLKKRGMSEAQIKSLFLDERMPLFSNVFFAVEPREPKRIYTQFLAPTRLKRTREYIQKFQSDFTAAEKQFNIPQEVVAAILLIETDLGRYTGSHRVLPRLARLANAGSPANVRKNYQRLRDDGEKYSLEEVSARGQYLLELFLPEVEAAVRIAEKRGFSPFSIKGSSAGAFGYAQFLPYSFERFAIDGNRDGKVSLFQHPDAIHSVANFLAHYLGDRELSDESLRLTIWNYNRSEPYVETTLKLAKALGLQ